MLSGNGFMARFPGSNRASLFMALDPSIACRGGMTSKRPADSGASRVGFPLDSLGPGGSLLAARTSGAPASKANGPVAPGAAAEALAAKQVHRFRACRESPDRLAAGIAGEGLQLLEERIPDGT